MEFKDVVTARHAVRKYKSQSVSDEVILDLVKQATKAPSSGNCQPWEFVVVKDGATKKKIVKLCSDQAFIGEASHVVVVCANLKRSEKDYGERGRTIYSYQDTAAAIMVYQLAAVDTGLATCWVGDFRDEAIADLLGLPAYVRPVAVIPTGYSAETDVERTKRTPAGKRVHYDRY